VKDGKAEVLASGVVTYQVSKAHQIRFEAFGDIVRCYLGKAFEPGGPVTPVDTVTDPIISASDTAFLSGKAGFYAFAQGGGNPVDTWFDDFAFYITDTDGDGLTNDVEREAGTKVDDKDSDDDGVEDGDEPLWNQDSDQDGLINALDYDSDDDGLPDGLEMGKVTPGQDTNITAGHFISDNDPTTTTDPLDPDTDGDTVSDGMEDENHNGRVDFGESDPNDPSDHGHVSDAGPDSGADGDADADADGDADAGQPINEDAGKQPVDAGEARAISGGALCSSAAGHAATPRTSLVPLLLSSLRAFLFN